MREVYYDDSPKPSLEGRSTTTYGTDLSTSLLVVSLGY